MPAAAPALNEGRGVNPGDTIDGRADPACTSTLNEGRGVNPGDTARPMRASEPRPTLNEGRGVNPGDTGGQGGDDRGRGERSTKAGA